MLTFITCHLLRCFYQKPVVTHANCILFVLTIMPSLMIICFYKIATCQHFNQRVQLSYKLPSIGINWVDFHSFSVCQGKARNLANTTGSDINFVLKMYYRCLLLPSPPPQNGNPLVLCLSYINCSVICLKALSERNIYTTTTISASENKNSLRAEKEQLKGDMFCA